MGESIPTSGLKGLLYIMPLDLVVDELGLNSHTRLKHIIIPSWGVIGHKSSVPHRQYSFGGKHEMGVPNQWPQWIDIRDKMRLPYLCNNDPGSYSCYKRSMSFYTEKHAFSRRHRNKCHKCFKPCGLVAEHLASSRRQRKWRSELWFHCSPFSEAMFTSVPCLLQFKQTERNNLWYTALLQVGR